MRRSRSIPLFCMFCAILAATAFGIAAPEHVASAQAAPPPGADQRAQARDHYLAGKWRTFFNRYRIQGECSAG